MKSISELELPDNARYTEDHEYVMYDESGGDSLRVGLSDYAQDQLGDIVYVELPDIGRTYGKGDVFGVVESVKAVAELYMPVGAEIVSINADLENAPEHVNEDPYGKGWLMTVKPDEIGDMDVLMTADSYRTMLKGIE